jgi:argonaute-like protein implicated in RNA metabolism and viral defense
MINLTDLQKIKEQVELQIAESSTSVDFIDEYLRHEVPEQFKVEDLMFNKGQLTAYENILKVIQIIENNSLTIK